MELIFHEVKQRMLLSPSEQPYYLPQSPIPLLPPPQNLQSDIRFLMRPPNRDPEDRDNVTALQGQLQQLFHLHDAERRQAEIASEMQPCVPHGVYRHLALVSFNMPLCRASLIQISPPKHMFPHVLVLESVVPVRLGKYRNIDGGEGSSNSNVDDRRCLSMGSFEYVMDENLCCKSHKNSMKKSSSKKKTCLPLTPGYYFDIDSAGGEMASVNSVPTRKNQSCYSLDSQAKTPSFARDDFAWLAGKQNKVVHSSFIPNV
ncbi:hypothetical protein F3Y22_tig00111022pilonHSYRG00151 [Hibiscus syriacus]|uniref:RING-type E3 ubiquitin transferase n=1 Tax=Hibiscus syriacus TaxID=106335 RepID=A0A6A2Z7R1_HIBSY|nr:hypothetical protein F3Y22_tig00111022pilonHSYRG00151 [Hibiscus syriacus]